MRGKNVFAGAVKLLAASTPDSPTLLRETVSFLNSDGGIISFRPNGPSMQGSAVCRAICEGIRPDPAPYIRVDTDADGRQRVEIAPGRRRPYYVRESGMTPDGVFVRENGRPERAGALSIARMNRETYGDVFEKMRAPRQDLTFHQAIAAFTHSRHLLTPSSLPSYGITDPQDGEYTNLGYILSDQCPHSLLIERFADLHAAEPISVRELRGSVLRQYRLASKYLGTYAAPLCGAPMSYYPPEALQEALRNVIVHRDYSIQSASFIDIDHTGVEFNATGGLIASLAPEGESDPATIRNPGLNRILCVLAAVPTPCLYRMLCRYEGTGRDPVIDVAPMSFSIYLPVLRQQPDQTKTGSARHEEEPRHG